MSTGIKFDWTVSVNSIITVVLFVGATAVLFWRVAALEVEMTRIQARVEQFAKENNEAHLAIVTAATKVGTILDMHMKEGTKQ